MREWREKKELETETEKKKIKESEMWIRTNMELGGHTKGWRFCEKPEKEANESVALMSVLPRRSFPLFFIPSFFSDSVCPSWKVVHKSGEPTDHLRFARQAAEHLLLGSWNGAADNISHTKFSDFFFPTHAVILNLGKCALSWATALCNLR